MVNALFLITPLLPLLGGLVDGACVAQGSTNGTCVRLKDEKFQIRGVNVVPMWKYMLQKENNPNQKFRQTPFGTNFGKMGNVDRRTGTRRRLERQKPQGYVLPPSQPLQRKLIKLPAATEEDEESDYEGEEPNMLTTKAPYYQPKYRIYQGKVLPPLGQKASSATTAPESEEGETTPTSIRDLQGAPIALAEAPNVRYSYPPKDTFPLPTCFSNPSGYVCCNLDLNNVVEKTFKKLKAEPDFNPCNLQKIANRLQKEAENMFQHPFESVAAHADFAQSINFSGDLVCKLEIDGKFLLAYATPFHAEDALDVSSDKFGRRNRLIRKTLPTTSYRMR